VAHGKRAALSGVQHEWLVRVLTPKHEINGLFTWAYLSMIKFSIGATLTNYTNIFNSLNPEK
jgi:hypothetical protein